MTIGTVRFYKMRGSLSSGEYPLFSPNQNLSSYLVHSVTAKYSKGLQTTVPVPAFTGYETVNVVEIDGQYYWVTEWHESTTVNESITFVLDYMAPTSLMRSGQTFKGIYKRTPSNLNSYMRNDMHSGIMKEDRVLRFSNLELKESYINSSDATRTRWAYWCQVTGTTSNNGIKQYGFFINYAVNTDDFQGTPVTYRNESGGVMGVYPTIAHILGWRGSFSDAFPGLTAESVTDVSISKRCPFRFARSAYTTSTVTNYSYYLVDGNGSPYLPDVTVTLPDFNDAKVYDISSVNMGIANVQESSQTITISLTGMERATGEIVLKDWNRNDLLVIPTQLGSSISVTAQCHSDISGVNTVIKVGDMQITVPEGKLPYVGTTSDTYRAYQMNSDRLALQQALQRADHVYETDLISTVGDSVTTGLMGATMGGLTGNPITAVAGVLSGVTSGITGVYRSTRADELTRESAKMNFELMRKRALEQPTSGYNTGYGTIYAYLNQTNPLKIVINKPGGLTTTYYNNWIAEYGYPAEGVLNLTIANGFIQGKLISDTSDKSGMYWDELNRTAQTGFKFVTP